MFCRSCETKLEFDHEKKSLAIIVKKIDAFKNKRVLAGVLVAVGLTIGIIVVFGKSLLFSGSSSKITEVTVKEKNSEQEEYASEEEKTDDTESWENTDKSADTPNEINNNNQSQKPNSKGHERDIFPDSSERLLTTWEVDSLSNNDLRIAINEIYARNHYFFQTPE